MAKVKPQILPTFPKWALWLYALASFILVPVLIYKPAIDVSLTPKYMALSILLLTYTVIFLLMGKLRMPDTSLLRRLPVLMWIGFVLVSALSLVAAINPYEGLFDILHAILSLIFILITTSILIRSNDIRPFILSAIMLTFGFVVLGFSQYFEHVFRHADLDALYKVNGMMSHKNVFSCVLFMLIPLLYYSILTANRLEKILSLIALSFNITLLLLLQTRSIWLAIAVFIAVSTLLALIHRKGLPTENRRKLFHSVLFLAIVHIVAFGAAYQINRYSIRNPFPAPTNPKTEKISDIDKRVVSIFDTKSANRQKRISVWMNTLDMVQDHPWLGVGAGNWKIIIPSYYQPDPDESYYHNWRRPHNDFLWALADKGIFGLLFFLGFFISTAIVAIRALRKASSEKHKILVILMVAGVAGYCVDACFSFPYERVDIRMFLMFFVSSILWIYHTGNPVDESKSSPGRVTVLLISALLLVSGIFIGKKMVKAETYTNMSYTANMANRMDLAVLAIDKGYSKWAQLDPSNNPMHWFRGNANLQRGRLQDAKTDLHIALEQNPYSVPTMSDLATVYYYLKDYDKAIEYFKKGLEIYPGHRYSRQRLGMSYAAIGKYQEAIECYYKCKTDQPNPTLDDLIQEAYLKLVERDSPMVQ